jgi:hypothetical protein
MSKACAGEAFFFGDYDAAGDVDAGRSPSSAENSL